MHSQHPERNIGALDLCRDCYTAGNYRKKEKEKEKELRASSSRLRVSLELVISKRELVASARTRMKTSWHRRGVHRRGGGSCYKMHTSRGYKEER